MRVRSIARAIVVAIVVLTVLALGLSLKNGTFSRDPFTILSVAMLASYAAVGAFVATRLPGNPIGWLLLLVGFGVLLGGFASEYATYALLTSPGSLPFGRWAAWTSNWAFLFAPAGVPLVLLFFPTGRVPSRRWRWMPTAVVACIALLTVLVMFSPSAINVTGELSVRNPLGIEALRQASSLVGWVAGLGLVALSLACAFSVLMRFRRSSGDERQQVRWLAYAAGLTGAMLVLILVTTIGVPQGGSSPINDLAFLLFFVSLGMGIPVAVAVALLKYRLYDLDLVLKKTVLYVTVAAVLFIVFIAVALAAGGLLGGGQTGIAFAAGAMGLLFWPALRVSRRVADRIVYGGRATPYEILSGFSERLSETYATDDVLPRTAQLLAGATGAANATVWLRIGGALRPAANWPENDRPAATVSLHGDDMPPLPADWAEEVKDRGELLGALAVDMPANDPIDPTRQRLVRDLAAQAGLVLRNVRLIEELRDSRRRIVAAQDDRARKLERNIHDGAQQQLVALAVQLRLLEQTIGRDADEARRQAGRLHGAANDALENLRDLARGIYPPLLADKGLAAALEAQARKAALQITLDSDGIGRYPQDTEAAVYFCGMEALQNAAKYAQASSVRIRLSEDDGNLRFEVADDGPGFDVRAVQGGTGLQGMADRVEAIGGTLEISSVVGRGTTVRGSVPVSPR
ncbi:MAG TPA: sensor histidine kinase [Actinomycetota bacterium]|nr:sensor histidine kinase [Actinomycetota bacterium]